MKSCTPAGIQIQVRHFGRSCLTQQQSTINAYPVQLTNRNPRNLERLRIDRKPEGWPLDTPSRAYWHKIFVTETSRYFTAYVQHNNGRIVAQASSKEGSFQKRLLSLKDSIAAETVGKVLAQRLLMMGLAEVHSDFGPEEMQSEKVKKVLKALEESGISLKEPERYMPPAQHRGKPADEKPWDTVLDS
ncbi:large ribosomal subunit protein uL18m-like [Artemia franciscana]|uniref:Large ribosomal subunit protein uL18m n=1 Tax=Artemia franciscana TaxID=6661 RepID=A0AA88HKB0_ARTSF|nr:hypothetical protein QYM36_012196 [Artemia franciscana]